MEHTWIIGNLTMEIVNKKTGTSQPRSGSILYMSNNTRPHSNKGLFIYKAKDRCYWQPLLLTEETTTAINSPQSVDEILLNELKNEILQNLNIAPKLAILFATATENMLVKAFGCNATRTRILWPDAEFAKFQREPVAMQQLKDVGITATMFQQLQDLKIVKLALG